MGQQAWEDDRGQEARRREYAFFQQASEDRRPAQRQDLGEHRRPFAWIFGAGNRRAERYDEEKAIPLKRQRSSRYGNLAEAADANMFYPIFRTGEPKKVKKYVLNIVAMHAVVLRDLQMGIARDGKLLLDGLGYEEEVISGRLQGLIHKYCDALRDMDYMQLKAAKGYDEDPFLLQTSRQGEADILLEAGLIPSPSKLPRPEDENLRSGAILPGLGRNAKIRAERKQSRYVNFIYALAGGLALVVPMIIMKLLPGTLVSLITASGFVVGFAVVIAWRSDLKPQEILGLTAAYAAVLVVFVGVTP